MSLAYFSAKGMQLYRLPFLWERVQPTDFGELDANNVGAIRGFLDGATAVGGRVILDLHNYGRRYGAPVTIADGAKLADVWSKLAVQFGNHPALYGYELMNEPHDLPDGAAGWASICQTVTTAIRAIDPTNFILIPGYAWQTARFWRDYNESLNIAGGNILYAAHQYFDADYTGSYQYTYDADGTTPTIGAERLQPFLDWLTAHTFKGILTEYGVPNTDSRWNVVLNTFLASASGSGRIVGGTYWAAGPFWGAYILSIEPLNGADRPQMSVLVNYSQPAP